MANCISMDRTPYAATGIEGWHTLYDFYFPPLPSRSCDDVRHAYATFTGELLAPLNNVSYECCLAEDGELLARETCPLSEMTRIIPGPRRVHSTIRKKLCELRLSKTPPEFTPNQLKMGLPGQQSDVSCNRSNSSSGKNESKIGSFENSMAIVAIQVEEARAHFSMLSEWLFNEHKEGRLLPAIQEWYRSAIERRLSHTSETHIVPFGADASFSLNGYVIRIRVSDCRSTTISLHSANGNIEAKLKFKLPVGEFFCDLVHPNLANLHFENASHGVSISATPYNKIPITFPAAKKTDRLLLSRIS